MPPLSKPTATSKELHNDGKYDAWKYSYDDHKAINNKPVGNSPYIVWEYSYDDKASKTLRYKHHNYDVWKYSYDDNKETAKIEPAGNSQYIVWEYSYDDERDNAEM